MTLRDRVLAQLREHGPQTINQLTAALGNPSGSISSLLGRMYRGGHLNSSPGQSTPGEATIWSVKP